MKIWKKNIKINNLEKKKKKYEKGEWQRGDKWVIVDWPWAREWVSQERDRRKGKWEVEVNYL